MRETAKTIEETALHWVARLDREGQTQTNQVALNLWLDEDPRHRGAFMRAQAAWQMLDRATALPPQETSEITYVAPLPKPSRRWLLAGATCAASVAAAYGINHLRNRTAKISTARGEIRRVPLEDGSLLAINTETSLKVALAPDLRSVKIDRGEAWVQVVSDAARPFIVSAGDIRIRAVGTAFSVRKTDEGAEVLVTEGVVETWSSRNASDVQRLSAGQGSFINAISGRTATENTLDEVHRKLAWREGEIVLAGETLRSAVSEFNRYNEVQIELADPAIADTEWVGRFRTNEPQAFARAVAITTGVPVSIGPATIRIGRTDGYL